MQKQWLRYLYAVLFFCFFVNICTILYFSIMDTQNNLPVSKMIILPIILTVLFTAFTIAAGKIPMLMKILNYKSTFIIFIILYTLCMMYVCYASRTIPDNDHAWVYNGALYMAGVTEEGNWEYFARSYNNIPPMLYLSLQIKINQLLGFSEPYILPVLVNILQIDIAMVCVYHLLKENCTGQNKILLPWAGIILLACFFPTISHSQATYTDGASFCFSIAAYYLWHKSNSLEKQKRKIIYCIFAGVIWGFGASIKMTVLISFIAVLCALIIEKKLLQKCKEIVSAAVGIVCVLLCVNIAVEQLPSAKMQDSHGLPTLSYWIGIGIQGNGGYTDNQEYSITLNTIYGMDAKEEYSRQYIKENLHQFWNASHLVGKVRHNFASGNFGASDYMRNTERDNFVFQSMSTEGRYFWRFSMIMASYFYAMLILLAVNIAGYIKKIINGTCTEMETTVILTIIGLMIYLMIFEANNRQLYNHLSWFVLGAALGIGKIRAELAEI